MRRRGGATQARPARPGRFSAPTVQRAIQPAQIQLDRARRESTGAVTFVPGTVGPFPDDAYIEDADDPDYQFPLWWFFLAVPSQSFGPWIVGGTLWGMVVPHTIAANFGSHEKALVLASLGTLGTVMSFAGPFIGTLSDRLPEAFPNFTARFGRRRPFFFFGQILGVTGIWVTAQSLYHRNTLWLFVSWAVSNLSWQIAGPPYGAIFQVRGVTFSFLCPLLEKYGTFIARCNALIEKVSPRVGDHPRVTAWARSDHQRLAVPSLPNHRQLHGTGSGSWVHIRRVCLELPNSDWLRADSSRLLGNVWQSLLLLLVGTGAHANAQAAGRKGGRTSAFACRRA
eukprot:SAG31_NODE_1432_length_8373_cov_8.838289_13_plen_340_part_00